jgi:hypothetical protein
MSNISDYDKIRADAKQYYSTLIPLNSPALNMLVSFSSKGFNHILYRKDRNERDRDSQILRFKLLSRSYELVGLSTTFQEYEEEMKDFWVVKGSQKVLVSKQVKYWGLIAIIRERKIKVILRKIGNGNVHFWSIIPAWTTNKSRDAKLIKTMKGDPEND